MAGFTSRRKRLCEERGCPGLTLAQWPSCTAGGFGQLGSLPSSVASQPPPVLRGQLCLSLVPDSGPQT